MKVRLLVVLALTVLAGGMLPAVVSATAEGTEQTYIVLYKSGASSKGAATVVSRNGGTLVANYSAIGVVVARSTDPAFGTRMRGAAGVEGAASTAGLATRVDADVVAADDVAAAVDSALATFDDTSEPLWGLQWDMAQINTPDAHEITTGSPSVTVADLDTGLDFTHPDLAPNYDASKSADCSSGVPTPLLPGNDQAGHGTHTAGTIAAAANGIGIVGTAPGVKIAGVKTSNDDGFFFPEMVVCAYMWVATNNIQVTNNSYFADPWLFNCVNDPEQRAIWKAEQRAIRYAMSKGTTVVASAGNFADDLANPTQDVISPDFPPGSEEEREITNACRVVPSEVPGVVTVSATGPTGLKSFYSSYGEGVVDVAAPGGDSLPDVRAGTANGRVLSTWPSYLPCTRPASDGAATYCYLQGTSMAAPHATGVAALIWSVLQKATQAKVAARLGSTATPTACPTDYTRYEPFPSVNNGAPQVCTGDLDNNSWYGKGIIDAYAAITN